MKEGEREGGRKGGRKSSANNHPSHIPFPSLLLDPASSALGAANSHKVRPFGSVGPQPGGRLYGVN